MYNAAVDEIAEFPMERQQILIDRARKRRVAQLAKQLNCSASEVYRKAIDAFDPARNVDEVSAEELNRLLRILSDTNRRVNEALDETESKVAKALAFYAKRARKRAVEKAASK